MENLIIKGASDTFFTPNVNFDAVSGKCVLSGESYLENTVEFYKTLLEWLKSYMQTQKALQFHFSLSYYNTSSNKALLQVMNLLKSYEKQGGKVDAYWYYNEDDDDMREEAEDYELDSDLKLNIIPGLLSVH
jgi:hypothetical protein